MMGRYSPLTASLMSIYVLSAHLSPEQRAAVRSLMREPKASKYPPKPPAAAPSVPVETRQTRRRREREEAKNAARNPKPPESPLALGVKCGATFTFANGETVSPCQKPDGHTDDHEGICLGSPCRWSSDQKHTSEEEEHWKRESQS